MSDGFTLSVPGEARFRVLVAELAGRFAKLIGGTDADADALASAVSAAVDRRADDAGAAHDIAAECQGAPSGIDVTLRGDGAAPPVRVHQPLHVRKG